MNTCPICKQEINGDRCNNISCAMFASPPVELEQVRAVIEAERRGAYERARDEAAKIPQCWVGSHVRNVVLAGIEKRIRAMQYHPAAPASLSAADEAEQVERERRGKMS